MKSKYFTSGYIYIYSLVLAGIDTLTISRDTVDPYNFEVFSLRVVGIFSYWLIVKNLAGVAEKKGYSYKIAMIVGIMGLPTLAGLLSLALLKVS
jgi:hypothetical protein